jgi:uncharacterized repeat protein (TIGR03803 family)
MPVPFKNLLQILKVTIAVAAILTAFAAVLAAAPKEKVLHAFSGNDGAQPESSLTFDAAGNLYGTTYGGANTNNNLCGSAGCGTVFELMHGTNGGWQRRVLHAFTGGSDGAHPLGTLVFDAEGNLYGTTSFGGSNTCNQGCGTVFKLTPASKGRWKETVLYAFTDSPDGASPAAGVIFDGAGNLYGTTRNGGDAGEGGTVFTLTPTSSGWKETVLYSFVYGCGKNQGSCGDGASPQASLIFDAKGNLYGTTFIGGTGGCSYNDSDGVGCGTVFELTSSSNGWTETVLYSFTGEADGGFPVAGLVMDTALNLYGTSELGGGYCNAGSCGNVFRLMQTRRGQWKETVIHNFEGKDGATPQASLIMDRTGDLFGTTSSGTRCCSAPPKRGPCCGTVFELTRGARDAWKETVLHNFTGGNDGLAPYGGVIFDAAGNLYGTTAIGGKRSDGVVFQITP